MVLLDLTDEGDAIFRTHGVLLFLLRLAFGTFPMVGRRRPRGSEGS